MMMKALCVITCFLGTIVIHHGCATERKSVADHESGSRRASCGSNVCTGQTYCCNASCGICAPLGGFCTQQACVTSETSSASNDGTSESNPNTPESKDDRPTDPSNSRQCGKARCTGNTHCCNPSCGICVPPDGVCTQQFCEPQN